MLKTRQHSTNEEVMPNGSASGASFDRLHSFWNPGGV